MSHALAGDVSLNLCLVDSIDTEPNECPSDRQSPKRVSPQRAWIKADGKSREEITSDVPEIYR